MLFKITYLMVPLRGVTSLYVPGIGSISDETEHFRFSRNIKKTKSLIFGFELFDKIHVAYSFLSEHYNDGDKIFLFGFSRGAYSCKVLAGLIHACGLLSSYNIVNFAQAYELYINEDIDFAMVGKFKSMFSKYNDITFEFIGLWDSVSSVGNLIQLRNYPYTTNVQNANILRHAVAIDERRFDFKNKNTASEKDFEEIWFSGVHTDVGGGNPESESGLSKIPLRWIVNEGISCGLKIDQNKYDKYVLNVSDSNISKPDSLALIHQNSKKMLALNIIPRIKITQRRPRKDKFIWPILNHRIINDGAIISQSVIDRMNSDPTYKPDNLPENYSIKDV